MKIVCICLYMSVEIRRIINVYISMYFVYVLDWILSIHLSQVWMVVQRKWMYLEGIFIGGDIRSQLPEEAKKFDQIDKTFKKVGTRLDCYWVVVIKWITKGGVSQFKTGWNQTLTKISMKTHYEVYQK